MSDPQQPTNAPPVARESEPTEADIRRLYAKGLQILAEMTAERDAIAAQLDDAKKAMLEIADECAALQAENACLVSPEERDQWKRAASERDALAQQLQQAQAEIARLKAGGR